MAGFTALFFVAMIVYYAFRENDLVAQRLRADARACGAKLQAIEDLARLRARETPAPGHVRCARPYR